MNQLVIFLEEPSAKAMLENLFPRILPQHTTVKYIVFEGKQDLEKRLGRRLRAWQAPNSKFVVLRDKDAGDCFTIKAKLREICRDAGKEDALVRIACHELESWYLGDLNAVESALNERNIANQQRKAKFRKPDKLPNPARELKMLAKSYQKVSGSRAIGKIIGEGENLSHSFNVFINGVMGVVESFPNQQ